MKGGGKVLVLTKGLKNTDWVRFWEMLRDEDFSSQPPTFSKTCSFVETKFGEGKKRRERKRRKRKKMCACVRKHWCYSNLEFRYLHRITYQVSRTHIMAACKRFIGQDIFIVLFELFQFILNFLIRFLYLAFHSSQPTFQTLQIVALVLAKSFILVQRSHL